MLDVLNSFGSDGISGFGFSRLWEEIMTNLNTERAVILSRFVNFTYWSRIWIVHEILLAGPKSIMTYGTRRFPMNKTLRTVTRFAMEEASKHPLRNDIAIGKAYDPAGVGFILGQFVKN